MSTMAIDGVIQQLKSLSYESQWRVLEIIRSLALSVPRGIPGHRLLRFAGTIPPDDVQRMHQAIEQGCEQIDVGEW